MQDILLLIPQGDEKRVWSLLLPKHLFTGAAHHHVLAEGLDVKVLSNKGTVGLELNEVGISLHLFYGRHLPINEVLGIGVEAVEDGLHFDLSYLPLLQVIEGVLSVPVTGERRGYLMSSSE